MGLNLHRISRLWGDRLRPSEWEPEADETIADEPELDSRPADVAMAQVNALLIRREAEVDTIRNGVQEVRWAPRPLRWTAELPWREGYWYLRIAPEAPRLVVEVYKATDGKYWFRWSDIPPTPLAERTGYAWAGPLPEVRPAENLRLVAARMLAAPP